MISELYRRVARLFVVGFPGLTADRDVRALIDDGVGGVILFKRNVESPAQVAALVKGLKAHAGRPLLAAVDQEGGRVARLRGPPFTALPPMREVGRTGDAALAARVGRLLAYEVRALGFDQDYAPVLDVDTNPANPVIGDRALHRDAAEVARLGVALAQGLEAGGVASCGKHFPGHGDTAKDSHLDLPTLPHDLARLRAVELQPFAAYARAGLASLMTAHVVFQAVDPGRPATMSRRVLTGVLREELGFTGVVVSDDLEMKAIADHYSVARAAVEGLQAGADQFLVCHHIDVQRRAIEAVVRAVEEGEVSGAQLDAALARVDALMRRFVRGPEEGLTRLGSEEHRALSHGLGVESFTGADPTERHG
jgi:beta-N-acetylhexosaminidase